jgi:hypothetical protein
MKDIHTELNKTIEKIFKIRLDEIIEKSNLNEDIINKIKDTNDTIAKGNRLIKNKKEKNNIEKKDKKLSTYTIFVKDANCIIKNNDNLNYLPNDIVTEIRKLKDKLAKEQFKELGILWKKLDDNTINKYKNLVKNKDFTNEKYNNIVGKPQTPKMPRKKKSKESLK